MVGDKSETSNSAMVVGAGASSLIDSFCWGNEDADDYLVTTAVIEGRVTIVVQVRVETSQAVMEQEIGALLSASFDLLAGSTASVSEGSARVFGSVAADFASVCAGVISLDQSKHHPAVASAQRAQAADALAIVVYEQWSGRYRPVSVRVVGSKSKCVFGVEEVLAIDAATAAWGQAVIEEAHLFAHVKDRADEDGPRKSRFRVVDGIREEIAFPDELVAYNEQEWKHRARKRLAATQHQIVELAPVAINVSRNLMEIIADPDECAFDQPCRFGNRVGGHAVYCHNEQWEDAPRKCRRTRYTGGVERDEDCPGFESNPNRVSE